MYKISYEICTTPNQDGAIVLDIHHGKLLRLNITGALIFERLRQGQTESQIVHDVSREFGISHELARADVDEFLKSIEAAGLIERDETEVHPWHTR